MGVTSGNRDERQTPAPPPVPQRRATTRSPNAADPAAVLAAARNGGSSGHSASASWDGTGRDRVISDREWDTFTNWGNNNGWKYSPRMQGGPGPGPSGPPRGPGGGGGGGGGGRSQADIQKGFESYYAQVLKALGQMPGVGEDLMTGRINDAVDADVGFANQTFDNVNTADFDPYKDFAPQATQIDPGISAMMEAQGMGGEAALAQGQAANQGLQQMSDLWANYGKAQSADQQASNARFNSGVQSDRAGALNELGGQRSALQAAAAAQREQEAKAFEMKKWEAMLQLLGSGYSSGADVGGLDFGGLFG